MLHTLSATEMAAQLRARSISAVELTQHLLDRIDRVDADVKAFLSVDPDRALAQAAEAQTRLDAGDAPPLCGVPIALKDNISTAGMRTTCASKMLENYVPPFDATVTSRLRSAGSIVIGKTNLDEFAMGTSCENSAFFPTRNPWDLERSPGGSSGGSAAAVAASLVPLALGSDTGGSIRMPAALCGIVGFKPTYGRVSRYGLVAFGSSLDQIGPFAWSVEDAAHLAQQIIGHDPLDSTSLPDSDLDLTGLKSKSLRGLKFGLPDQMFGESIDAGVRAAIEKAIGALEREGATVERVSLPTIDVGVTTYYIIAPSEASSNLARFDGVRYGMNVEAAGHVGMVAAARGNGFGHEVKARIMIGTYALSAGYYDAYYLRAQKVRALMTAEFNRAFQTFDYLLAPTSPIPAFRLGELSDDPLALKQLDLCTIPANMGGFPALSLAAGEVDGLPVGLQIMGPAMGDEDLLAAAYAIEQTLGRSRRPIA